MKLTTFLNMRLRKKQDLNDFLFSHILINCVKGKKVEQTSAF